MSFLRIVGLLCGVLCLIIAFLRLRYSAQKRTDVWLLSTFGLILLSISLMPGLLNIPAEIFSMRDNPKGRVITLLLISSGSLWLFLFYERGKGFKTSLQLDKFVRSVAVKTFQERYHGNVLENTITIIMPAYNEEENLVSLLPKIPDKIFNTKISVLVIDDGSTDNTARVAEKNGAFVIKNPINRGGGAALKAGYDVVRRTNPKFVVTMDADGQHNPEEISTLVQPLMENKADFVIGSRLLGSSMQSSKVRIIGVHVFNRLINLLLGISITDCSSGFRAVKMSVIKASVLEQEQYHTSELIIEAAKRNFRIIDKPVTINERLSGVSKKGADLLYGLFFLRAVLKTWLR